MDKCICQICGTEVEERKHFWSQHKIKEADYYYKFYPRYCKHAGERLVFKNPESYFENDFADKRQMAAWFKKYPEEAKDYAVELLKRRKERKGILYAPSQVELRSLMIPSMIWFKKNFESYGNLCETIGLKKRFDKENELIRFGNLSPHDKIIIDTREQLSLKFKDIPTEILKLDYGDYALSPNKFKVHIERKNLSDFVGTLGVGFDRFCREIERAKKDRAYLIVLVESSINDTLSFNYLPQMKYCKVGPEYIFHHVREIMEKYNNIQFLFCDGRKEAAELVKKIFSMKKHPKHWDFQYLYDTKEL